MKYFLACIVGAFAGSACTYFYMGQALGGASQMSYEVSLSNDLRAIEILETHNSESLRETLIAGLACAGPVYEENLDSAFWKRTDYSKELLQKIEKYRGRINCPSSEGNA